MRKTSVETIANWTQGQVSGTGYVCGLAVDSRKVLKDDLFVCLLGDRVDGHDFAHAAKKQGAAALLVSRRLDEIDLPQILVKDTLTAMNLMALAYRDTLDAFIIGITGSNGKTSTKDILDSCLSLVGKTVSTHLNQNTEIGTYLNLFKLDDDSEFGIFEFGLDIPGDIQQLVDIMKPDAAILTSLAPAHMMNFKDIDHIANEKVKIFSKIKDPKFGFYQGDHQEYKDRLKDKFMSFGFDEDNDFLVSDVVLNNDGIEFKVNQVAYQSNLLGKHQASNAAAVIALLKAMAINDAIIDQGLDHVKLSGLRMQIEKYQNSTIILDAYKSNPASLIYALEFMDAYHFKGKRYAVLSEMVELGQESKEAHQQVLEAIQKLNLDGLYVLGDEFKSFEHTYAMHALNDKKLFKEKVKKLFKEDALILIKGSRSYALETLIGKE